jgi:hypothetical protein
MMLMRLPIAALIAAKLLLLPLVFAVYAAARAGRSGVIVFFDALCRVMAPSLKAALSNTHVTPAKAGAPLDRKPKSGVPAFAGMTDSWCVDKDRARQLGLKLFKKSSVPSPSERVTAVQAWKSC